MFNDKVTIFTISIRKANCFKSVPNTFHECLQFCSAKGEAKVYVRVR